jgi:D-apionolactonase
VSLRRLTKAEKIFGTTQPTNKTRLLTAGRLTALLDGGGLRNIQYNGIEVVRGISYLCRNADWGTYDAAITNFRVKQDKEGFSISYHAKCKDHVQELNYLVTIEASNAGLHLHAKGTPHTDFITNRTGFVVLHPLEGTVGQKLTVTHSDHSNTETHFPRYISPGQPIFNIRALTYDMCPGVTATLTLNGDTFEMEDHRNWMDASYKTYVHSLKDIWPYTLKRGVPFEQSVTLTFEGQPHAPSKVRRSDTIKIKVGHASGIMPVISTEINTVDIQTLSKFRLSGIKSFVARLDGRQNDVNHRVKDIASALENSVSSLKLELILPAKKAVDEEIKQFAKAITDGGVKPDAVVITHAHDLVSYQPEQARPKAPSYEEMAAAARLAFPSAAIGGGVLTNFTELNRNSVPRNVFDFVTHSLCPTVHASDDLSVMETLESLPWIFDSVRNMVGELPYHIGPTSISAQSNPYGKGLTPNPKDIRTCLAERDPREKGLFFAVWSFALIAACAKFGIKNVSIRNLSPPARSVVGWLARAVDTSQLDTNCSQPTKVVTLACEFKAGKALWIANISRETCAVQVSGLSKKLWMQRINTGTFNSLSQNTVLPKPMPAAKRFDLKAYELVLLTTKII